MAKEETQKAKKPKEKPKIKNWTIIRRTIEYVLPFKMLWAGLVALSLVVIGIGLIDPLILKFLFDNVLIEQRYELLLVVLLVFLVAKTLSIALTYLYGVGYTRFSENIFLSIRNDLFEHLQYKEMGFYTNLEIGDLLHTLMQDVESLRGVVKSAETVFNSISRLIFILGVILFFDWRLALIGVFVLPLYGLIQSIYLDKVRQQTETSVQANVNLLNFFEERLSNILLVKLFSSESREAEAGSKVNKEQADQSVKLIAMIMLITSLVGLISGLALIVALWIGARSVISGALTVGALMAIYTYIGQLFGPISAIIQIPAQLQSSFVAGRRVFSILEAPEERNQSINERSASKLQGKIEFDHVTFAYPAKPDRKILDDLSFKIAPGETVGIVGGSGSGKTTVIRLLLRFYDANKGEILLDDNPISIFERRSLRKRFGVLLQDLLFLPETIRSNITYSLPNASAAALEEVAKDVGVYEQIMKRDEGFNTILGPDGKPLSPGEQQRLSIARVCLKDPDIFIFDEPTAGLDAESEQIITEHIEKLSENRTSIVIAHRMFTLDLVDRILVFKDGKVVEDGPFEDLLNKKGEFHRLYCIQNKNDPHC